ARGAAEPAGRRGGAGRGPAGAAGGAPRHGGRGRRSADPGGRGADPRRAREPRHARDGVPPGGGAGGEGTQPAGARRRESARARRRGGGERGWPDRESGGLYRALTLAALDPHGEPGAGSGSSWSAQRIIALAEELPVRLVLVGDVFRPEVAGVDVEEAIRSERVTRRVSELAAIPEVRHWVNVQQRDAALRHSAGVVVAGRDIGTVVFPDAPLTVFLIASPEERAR